MFWVRSRFICNKEIVHNSAYYKLKSFSEAQRNNKKPEFDYHGQKYFKKDIASNFPEMLRWLSLIYFILSLIGICLLSRPIKAKQGEMVPHKDIENECPSLKTGLKTKDF